MKTCNQINDKIENCDTNPTPETILEVLRICSAINERLSALEASHKRVSNESSCLANGIQPD